MDINSNFKMRYYDYISPDLTSMNVYTWVQGSCWVCYTMLQGKDISKEHLIPEAIGGKLITKNFICRDCNSKFGSGEAKELINIYKTHKWLFASFQNNIVLTSKDRKKSKNFIKLKEAKGNGYYIVYKDGLIVLENVTRSNEVSYTIHVGTDEQKKTFFESVKNRLVKNAVKDKLVKDKSDIVVNVDRDTNYNIPNNVHFTERINPLFVHMTQIRSILGYASILGYTPYDCVDALWALYSNDYIKDDNFELSDLLMPNWILNRKKLSDINIIAVYGCRKLGMLFGYCTLLPMIDTFIVLSLNYNGPEKFDVYPTGYINEKDFLPPGIDVGGINLLKDFMDKYNIAGTTGIINEHIDSINRMERLYVFLRVNKIVSSPLDNFSV